MADERSSVGFIFQQAADHGAIPEVLLLGLSFQSLWHSPTQQLHLHLGKHFPFFFIAHYNCTVVISSHMLGELEKIAAHYGIVRGGKMIKEMTAEELEAGCRTYAYLKIHPLDGGNAFLEKLPRYLYKYRIVLYYGYRYSKEVLEGE